MTKAETEVLHELITVENEMQAAGAAVDMAMPDLYGFLKHWSGINWAMQMDGSASAPASAEQQSQADAIMAASGLSRAEARTLSARLHAVMANPVYHQLVADWRRQHGRLPTMTELLEAAQEPTS